MVRVERVDRGGAVNLDHASQRAALRALVSSTFRAGQLDAYRLATQQLRDLDAAELNAAYRAVSP